VTSPQNPNLGEAASSFLSSLPPKEGEVSQQAVYGFVRWCGWESPCAGITAREVANYAEQLPSSQANYLNNLETVRAYLHQEAGLEPDQLGNLPQAQEG
jgi:hypothetical protein